MLFIRSSKLKNQVNVGLLFLVMIVWSAHLGYPMHRLQNIRWQLLGYSAPIYYFFTVFLMVGAAGAVLTFKRHWTKWELFWWLLPLICLPGVHQSSDSLWSLRQWFSWIIRGVIPGGIIFLTVRKQKQSAMLLYWIYPIVIAASLLGLIEIFFKHNPLWDRFDYYITATSQPANPFYRPENVIRLTEAPRGTQGNRIPYASTLVGFLPLGLWLLKYRKKYRLVHLAAIAILISILILAQVRSTWTAALAGIVLMQAIGLHRTRRDAIKFLTGVLLCLSVFLAWPKTRSTLYLRLNSFHISELSIGWRLDILETAAVLKDRWFLGVGFGQFPTACKPYYHGTQPWLGTADNQYLRWVTENGVPSLFILFIFIFGLIHAGLNQIKHLKDVEQADFYKSILVGWFSVAITFIFFDGFYWGACNMTFWGLLGMFATCLNSPRPPDQ